LPNLWRFRLCALAPERNPQNETGARLGIESSPEESRHAPKLNVEFGVFHSRK
jgi:hypothetical protein